MCRGCLTALLLWFESKTFVVQVLELAHEGDKHNSVEAIIMEFKREIKELQAEIVTLNHNNKILKVE